MNLPRIPRSPLNREKLPLFAVILYGLAGLSLILYTVMTKSVAFADWFNQGIGAGVRSALSLLTSRGQRTSSRNIGGSVGLNRGTSV